MKIKAVFFDLDGTLLPMDQEIFVENYFGLIAKKLASYGYESKKLIESMWIGITAMIKNNGEKTNEEMFFEKFIQIYGENSKKDAILFDEFYKNEFQLVKNVCGYNENSQKIVKELKNKGLRVILATNPVFPAIATESRISWAGLSPQDFDHYTTYENSRYCKPNLEYYKDILNLFNLKAEDCLMVGNDVNEDMIVKELGMKVFLLTDNIINKFEKDISLYPNGSFKELFEYIDSLL